MPPAVGVIDELTPDTDVELIPLIATMPGAFEYSHFGYWGGVTEGADAWFVRVEADIEGTEFILIGSNSLAVLGKA
jgi:hypothetical protein